MAVTEEVDAICDEASSATGLTDFGDGWFLEPLAAWVEDLHQNNLTEFGRRFLRRLAVRDLARRLRVLATLGAHPEIREVPIPPILYITGLQRSGTTLLHNLLALHPQARPILRWELMEPVPPPETATYGIDPRIAAVQSSVERLRGTRLERMHWVNADEPEECVWGYIDAVSMLGQSAVFCMPEWRRLLRATNFAVAFAHYRQLIQLLLWRHPMPPGGFLVLKAPQIGHRITSLAATFPEAHFVIPDRDPFRCVVSTAVIGEAIVEPFVVENPVSRDGSRSRLALATAGPNFEAIDEFTTAVPHRTTHVPYPRLVGDPAGATASILDTLGRPGPDLSAAIDRFLATQRSGRRAAPPPELDSMGYTRDDVWAEPAIRSYCDRFAIEPELDRLTGAEPTA